MFILEADHELFRHSALISEFGNESRIIRIGSLWESSASEAAALGAITLQFEQTLPVSRKSGRTMQIASAMAGLEEVLVDNPPRVMIVVGDSNTAVAGALTANSHGIPLVHVEAGLRSFDRSMPKEHNRVIIDHISDLLCAPTLTNLENLRAENVSERRIVLTGNTVMEAVNSQLPSIHEQLRIVREYELTPNKFVFASIRRPENLDSKHTVSLILQELSRIESTVLLSLDTETMTRIQDLGLTHLLDPLKVISSVERGKFLALTSQCSVLVSDSGRLQEECTVLKKPLLLIRQSTERPEVMGTFVERTEPSQEISIIVNEWLRNLGNKHHHLTQEPCPYDQGNVVHRIADAIRALLAAPLTQYPKL